MFGVPPGRRPLTGAVQATSADADLPDVLGSGLLLSIHFAPATPARRYVDKWIG